MKSAGKWPQLDKITLIEINPDPERPIWNILTHFRFVCLLGIPGQALERGYWGGDLKGGRDNRTQVT